MKAVLNHVAFLVENIESHLEKNPFSNELVGKIEEFESEGTRELYIGKSHHMGRLLLMEAIGDGPYKRAIEKRGPGLHHIALDVENIEGYVDHLAGSGWLLHPKSLAYFKSNRQVYLCRPGVEILIEVLEAKESGNNEYFIERVEFPFVENRLLKALSCPNLGMGDCINLSYNV